MSAYSYDPSNICGAGKDRMRFELGDVLVAEGADSAYLSDEEIIAVIEHYAPDWLGAKLELARGVYRRLSYEVDTRVGPTSFDYQQRASRWKSIVDEIEREKSEASSISAFSAEVKRRNAGPDYFYPGMLNNYRAGRR